MRPILVLVLVVPVFMAAPAYAASSAVAQGRLLFPLPHIDFSRPGVFGAQSGRSEESGLLLSRLPTPPPAIERSILPSVNVGPFHATVGGMNVGGTHLGTYQLDTRDFWSSSVSGSVDSRGARVTFTLPTH